MANVARNLICESFSEAYNGLTDTRKNNFSRICNKLLNETFIYGSKPEDRNDYYETLTMKDAISSYFSLIDYDLIHVDQYKIFYIQTTADKNRIKLKKLETILLLILRLLYHKASEKVYSGSDIVAKVGDLVLEINKTAIYRVQPSNSEIFNSLRVLRRYKIINFAFSEMSEDSVITIYPTILYVVKIDNVDMLKSKLATYNASKGGDEDETGED